MPKPDLTENLVMNTGLPTLYSRRSDTKIQAWSITVNGDCFYTQTWIDPDGAVTQTEPTKCVAKRGTTPEQQAEKEARALWKKKQDEGYCTDKKDIDKPKFFAPMLAHVYDDYKEYVAEELRRGRPVYVQPKLDGMRCVAQEGGGSINLTSRNGKTIVSAPHISEAIFKLHEAPSVFDGELYADKFADNFNKIISLAKKTKPSAADLAESAKHLQYHIYDMPSAPGPFSHRLQALKQVLNGRSNMNNTCLIMVETVQVHTVDRIQELFGIWRGKGYEGAMIRLDRVYEQKRTKSLLKYKIFQEEEFTILDVVEGVGNRAGMAGAMAFKTASGKDFTAAVMGNVSLFRRYLVERKQLIGKVATIQFFNYTPDGLPRFPYVKGIRDYD